MGTFCLTWFSILFFSKLGLWDMVICTPILPTFLSSGGAYCFFFHMEFTFPGVSSFQRTCSFPVNI